MKHIDIQKVMTDDKRYVIGTYTRNPVCFVRGEGSRIWDTEGREYLDFFPGWGVSSLGHCHPAVADAVVAQAKTLMHMPNNFYNALQPELARLISGQSFGGKCFFANSGAEANEAAIKLVRAYGASSGRYEIITLEKSFHGRTMATLSATGQEKYHTGLGPILAGFVHVPINDISAFKKALTAKTAAVMLEPVQGEGGVNLADPVYIREIAELCGERSILFVFDEVQTGIGRTGRLFGYEHLGVTPDIMTLAKGLGSGVPIGAMVCTETLSSYLKPGMHASTFGGSPLVCAAAIQVMRIVGDEAFLKSVREKGRRVMALLAKLARDFPLIREVRGLGLMAGIELAGKGPEVFQTALAKGLVINCTAGNVIRFMPALTVTEEEIDRAVSLFREVLEEVSGNDGANETGGGKK